MDLLRIPKSINILLVDDSPSDVRLMREALRNSQLIVHVVVAKDGVEAIHCLNQGKQGLTELPDFILLDWNLPGKSGREVLADVKRDPALKPIPVLVMTSSHDERDVSDAYKLNANCFIQKPADLHGYETVIHAVEDFWFMTVTLPEADRTFEASYPALRQPLQ